MQNENPIKRPVAEGLHNHPAKNDGPDQTPVYEDLYHDEGRRNVLEEEAQASEDADSGG